MYLTIIETHFCDCEFKFTLYSFRHHCREATQDEKLQLDKKLKEMEANTIANLHECELNVEKLRRETTTNMVKFALFKIVAMDSISNNNSDRKAVGREIGVFHRQTVVPCKLPMIQAEMALLRAQDKMHMLLPEIRVRIQMLNVR